MLKSVDLINSDVKCCKKLSIKNKYLQNTLHIYAKKLIE